MLHHNELIKLFTYSAYTDTRLAATPIPTLSVDNGISGIPLCMCMHKINALLGI